MLESCVVRFRWVSSSRKLAEAGPLLGLGWTKGQFITSEILRPRIRQNAMPETVLLRRRTSESLCHAMRYDE